MQGYFQAAAPSRIIVLTDGDYAKGHINVDDINSIEKYNKTEAYNQSKLANMLFVRELAQRLRGTGVNVNAVDPGYMVDTDLYRFRWFGNGLAFPFVWTFMKSTPAGAQTILYVALKQNLKKKSGFCFK